MLTLRKEITKTISRRNAGIQKEESLISQANAILQQGESSDKDFLSKRGITLQEKAKDVPNTIRGSEIMPLCIWYNLRLLPVTDYKGKFPIEIVAKMKEFESKLTQDQLERGQYFILAPKESFKLQERPKDPIMFWSDSFSDTSTEMEEMSFLSGGWTVRIGGGLPWQSPTRFQANASRGRFYQVHEWGNDFTIMRRVSVFLKRLFGFKHTLTNINNWCYAYNQ